MKQEIQDQVDEGKELSGCPFCGGSVVLECTEKLDDSRAPRPHYVYQIECEPCGVVMEEWSPRWSSGSLGQETDEDRAARAKLITRWNTRTPKVE